MNQREIVLEHQLQQITNELAAIRRVKRHEMNKKYSGRFFRRRDNYGSALNKNDSWWTYYKVVSADHSGAHAVSFSVDTQGKVVIETTNFYPGLTPGFVEVTEGIFNRAAKDCLSEAAKLLDQKEG